jgi:general secretion pathway protein E
MQDVDDKTSHLLRERGRIKEADFVRAERLRRDSGGRLLRALEQLGLISEREAAEVLAEALGLPLVPASEYSVEPLFNGELSPRFLKETCAVPVADDDHVVLAMENPTDQYAIDAVSMAIGKTVVARVGVRSEIENAIERQYGTGKSAIGQVIDSIEDDGEIAEEDVEHLRDLARGAPIVRLVNAIFQRATETGASDIHIEPFEDRLRVRLRIDGVLREVEAPPARSSAAVISRIKIMAQLNIAERRLPQDGRIKIHMQGRELDLRVSTVPTLYGESVVIRLLEREGVDLDFSKMGFEHDVGDRFRDILSRPHGILLVTGPTGSGKTTTLYAALQHLNNTERKIITVEDPVEYQLDGINQIQVKPRIGLTFSNALRSIVRQDPDIIMIGEMRDLETARIAVQSALTGHLVLSTLHTNDAASGITRLLDMGIEEYLLTSSVDGILAQRLVRRLCTNCRTSYQLDAETRSRITTSKVRFDETSKLYRAVGCEHCEGQGYRGRTAILELLLMDESIRRLIMRRADATEIQRTAIEGGMRTMYQDGLHKALAGVTSMEEVIRVTEEL